MIEQGINDTAHIVINNVVKHFEREELLKAKTGKEYDMFSEEIEHLSLGPYVESVVIWNRDMELVWSSERENVGKRFPENHDLKKALNGHRISELTSAKSLGSKGHIEHNSHTDNAVSSDGQSYHDHGKHPGGKGQRLLELYVPLSFNDNEVSVVVEIYKNMDALYNEIQHHRMIIWYWTMIGFAVLYVVLFGIMWNASRRIDRHTREIKQSKQDWEETFNSITDMITVHDRDFNIIRYNNAADTMLELSSKGNELKCYTCFHGTGDAPEECGGSKCVHTGTPSEVEFFEPHLNKYIEIRAIPRIDEKGDVEGLIHVVRDISDRKRDEATIQTQINRLKALRSIDKAIIGNMNFKITLDAFLDHTMKYLEIDAASVLLRNKYTKSLEYVKSKGFQSDSLKYRKFRLGESHAGRAALERRIINIPNLKENTEGCINYELFLQEGFISYAAVPLIAKGQVNGVLEVFHRTFKEVDQDWIEFMEAIADLGAIAFDNSTLFSDLQQSNTELILAYETTIEGWSHALDLRDRETEGHTQRVSELTVHIAREMGIKKDTITHFRRGALLHDIGKMGVPDSILLKPGPLTDEEWEIMRMHPEYAYKMLYPVEYLRSAIDIPYYHHEKWDGTGYPKGLKGEAIPVSARIFAVIDVWDALRSDRPYRAAWPQEKVIEHIRSLSGTHFDPDVVNVFLQAIVNIEGAVVSYS